MALFGSYIEVYSTLKMEDFFRAKNLLSDHQIPYKDTSSNNQMRLAFNNLRGDNIALSRGGPVRSVYSLSVKKADEHRARQVLHSL